MGAVAALQEDPPPRPGLGTVTPPQGRCRLGTSASSTGLGPRARDAPLIGDTQHALRGQSQCFLTRHTSYLRTSRLEQTHLVFLNQT